MKIEDKIEYLLELASKLGVEIRAERLGGNGGGLCAFKGKSVLFIDLDADPVSRYEKLLFNMSEFGLDDIYVLPEIRDDIEKANMDR